MQIKYHHKANYIDICIWSDSAWVVVGQDGTYFKLRHTDAILEP